MDAKNTGQRPKATRLHANHIERDFSESSKHASLKQAAADTAEIVRERGIDYLVANGGLVPNLDAFQPIGALYVYYPLPAVRAGVWLI